MSFASFLYRFLSFSLCVCLRTHMRMNVCIVVYTCVWRCTLMGARGKCQMSNFVTPPHLPEASSLTEPGARLVASKLRKSSCLLPTPTSHTLEWKVCVLTPDILGGCRGSEFRCSRMHSKGSPQLSHAPCLCSYFVIMSNISWQKWLGQMNWWMIKAHCKITGNWHAWPRSQTFTWHDVSVMKRHALSPPISLCDHS